MRFFVQKLGCPKNDVDADYITARLLHEGHELVATPEEADSVIVNTCGFILPAKEESINELLRLGHLKKQGRFRTLYATGCLTQLHGDELLEGMPELDGAFGHGVLDSLAEAVGCGSHLKRTVRVDTRKLAYLDWRSRTISDGRPYAYVKISDGCDRACSYCTIPQMRGRFRSRPLESIIREAEYLASNGKKELILVSQEATLWGRGLPGDPKTVQLLEALDSVTGVEWIRLMYLHPAALGDELIRYMLDAGNKTLPYFDLPLQHANSTILKAMRRVTDRSQIECLLGRIRTGEGEATIRTTFIVGFPGETEDQFAELMEFCQSWKFDRLGVFPYSREEGTPAARMAGQIPETVKMERVDALMTRQREIAFERNEQLVGRTLDVIIDGPVGRESVGRTSADCPDIDQEVTVSGGPAAVGEIRRVRITSTDGYDLIGTLAEE